MDYLDGRLTLIDQVVGSRVASIQRLRYVDGRSAPSDDGPLQFCFDSGEVRRFDAGGDGERLAVGVTRWQDPFAEPLSDENRRFVLASGAWREFDVTREDPYRAVVGERLLGYRTTRTSLDALDGVILEFEELSIILETHGADELFVTWADPPLRVRPLS